MALTTSFASSSTSPSHGHVYDVFISHRGPDAKKGIASHIYHRLKDLGLAVFLDQPELQRGENLNLQLEGAIQTASVHIAIFSPEYANSHWCLDELLLMVDSGSTIIPVFYNVQPSDLRWTRAGDGVYARALRKLQEKTTVDSGTNKKEPRHESNTIEKWTRGGDRVYARALSIFLCILLSILLCIPASFLLRFLLCVPFSIIMCILFCYTLQKKKKKPRHDSDTIEKWREALSEVSKISGFELKECNNDEGQLVDKIVKQVFIKVRKPSLNVAKYPTGLPEKVKELEMTVSLQRQSGKASIVGIVGLGGIGKTTLAKELFNRETSSYDRSCFLFDVRSKSIPSLQSILLKNLIGLNVLINSGDEGIEILKRHLSSSLQVLIVLDDVDNIEQLDALFSPFKDTIDPGSLILVTSRNKDVLISSGIKDSSIYTLKLLNLEHSRELFCLHAFGQPHPVVGFEEAVENFLDACDGLPLSLRVLGALLHGNGDLVQWNAHLRKTSKILDRDIRSTLKISYDALDEEEKQIFLDIACFFIGEDRDVAIRIWDGSHWEGLLGLWKLENRCLVEVDSNKCLRMHDHVRDLGRDIAENSEYQRRLWRLTDNLIHNVSPVRGIIMVNENGPEQCFENLALSCNLSRLQLLRAESRLIEQVFSTGHLPPLIYLRWENCPNSSLPTSTPLMNLRVLHIEGKQLKTLWQHESQAPLHLRELYVDAPLSKVPESIGKLKCLEKFVLHHGQMTLLPDSVRNLTGLQSLDLQGCSTLQTLPDSVGNLTGLQRLDLRSCSTLQTLPDSVGNLTGLQRLDLRRCSTLQTLPDSVGNLTGLQRLDLGWCSTLQTLPDSVGNLTGLQRLDLESCSTLQTLPDSVGNLTGLQRLDLNRCSTLQTLPDSVGNLTGLQHLTLYPCSNLQTLPDSVGNLTGLQRLTLGSCSNLQTLPDSVGNLTGLQSLALYSCSTLQTLPDSVGNLTGLQSLALNSCSTLQTLPDSVGNLTGLQSLDLNVCSTLRTLPDSVGNLTGLQTLYLCSCSTLQTLPDSFGNLTGLQRLWLEECSTLQTLPDSVGNLTGLQSLDLGGCSTLQTLPDSVGNLTGLQSLHLGGCSTLQTLPDSVGNLTGLQSLHLGGCSILQTLPDWVGNLTGLQSLDLGGCSTLQTFPDWVGNLTGLQSLDLSMCSTLQTLPDWVGNLTGLQSLDLGECSTLQTLPDWIGNLTGLQWLFLGGCSTLQTLPDSVGNLTGLQLLTLGSCSNLQTLPDSVGNLTGLQSLDLYSCSTLQTLPDSVGNLTGLQGLGLLRCSTLQTLPDSVGNLTGLQSINLSGCSTLQTLPDWVGNLTGLQSLDLSRCSTLQTLPDSVGNLKGLRRLDLTGCSNLQMQPNIEHLSSLKRLVVSKCPKLQWGAGGAGVVEQLRQRLGKDFIEESEGEESWGEGSGDQSDL